MTKETLPIFMRHFNAYVRKHVPQNEKVLLTIDGHSSRKGVSWLEEASDKNIEVTKAPANTSHVLQPCDQRINKVINSRVRRVRNQLVAAGLTNTKGVQFKLISALAAIDDVSLNDIRVSFSSTRMWPMDMSFVKLFETPLDRIRQDVQMSPNHTRQPDRITADECRGVLQNTNLSPEEQLRNIAILLQNRQSTNSILMDMKKYKTVEGTRTDGIGSQDADTCASTNNKKKNYRLDQGVSDMSPARHLTHGESIQKLREKLAKEEEAQRKKEERKAERIRRKNIRKSTCRTVNVDVEL